MAAARPPLRLSESHESRVSGLGPGVAAWACDRDCPTTQACRASRRRQARDSRLPGPSARPAAARRRSPSGPASDQYQPEPRLNLPGPAPCHGDSVGPVTSRRPGSVTDSMTPPPRRPARGSPGPRPAARAAWRRDSKSNIPSDNLAMPRSQ